MAVFLVTAYSVFLFLLRKLEFNECNKLIRFYSLYSLLQYRFETDSDYYIQSELLKICVCTYTPQVHMTTMSWTQWNTNKTMETLLEGPAYAKINTDTMVSYLENQGITY